MYISLKIFILTHPQFSIWMNSLDFTPFYCKFLFLLIGHLVERLKLKKIGHLERGEVPSSSHNENNLLHCNKVFICQKNLVIKKWMDLILVIFSYDIAIFN